MNFFTVLYNLKIFQIMGLSRKSIRVILITLAAGTVYLAIRGISSVVIQWMSPKEDYNQVFQYETIPAVVFSLGYLLWVSGYFNGRRKGKFFLGTGLWVFAGILLGVILPLEIRSILATRFDQIQIQRTAQYLLPKPAYLPGDLFFAAIFVYSGYLTLHRYRRDRKEAGIFLKLAFVLSSVGLILNRFAAGFSLGPIFTWQLVIFTLVSVTGAVLFIKFVQTRDRLNNYRQKYEMLINEHTAVLDQATTRLTKRINYLEKVSAFHRQSEHRTRTLLNTSPEGAILFDLDGLILDINHNGASHWGIDPAQAKWGNIFDLLKNGQREILIGRMNRVLSAHQPTLWEETRSGRTIHHQLNPIRSANGSIIGFSAFSQDISEQPRIERETQRRGEDLEILNRVIELIAADKDITSVVMALCEMITEHYQAVFTYVLIPSSAHEDATAMLGYDHRIGRIKPILVNDLSIQELPLAEEPFRRRNSIFIPTPVSPMIPACIQQRMVVVNIDHALLLPIWICGEIQGMVAICRRFAFDPADTEDTRLAEAIVRHMAQALDHDRTVKSVREKAVREERDRLARDMHDSVTQTIYSASLITEVLPYIWDRNPEEGRRDLLKVRQLVRGALGEMRTILFELRPSALEMASLETLLRQLGFALSGRYRIQVQLTTDGEMPLPVEVKTTIYRITQEIFNNIAKHSEATQVQAVLKMMVGGLTLNIADNGIGFDPSQLRGRGMGLRIIEERAAMIGARIAIDSEPGQGTNVTLTWETGITGG